MTDCYEDYFLTDHSKTALKYLIKCFRNKCCIDFCERDNQDLTNFFNVKHENCYFESIKLILRTRPEFLKRICDLIMGSKLGKVLYRFHYFQGTLEETENVYLCYRMLCFILNLPQPNLNFDLRSKKIEIELSVGIILNEISTLSSRNYISYKENYPLIN